MSETTIRALLQELDEHLHSFDGEEEPNPAQILGRLVAAGWDPNQTDARGWTLLHELASDETCYDWAAGKAFLWLLDHGANVDAQDECGVTALHLAVLTEFVLVIETLLDRGADKRIRTIKPTEVSLKAARGLFVIPAGTSAFDLANDAGCSDEIIEALR